MSHINNINKMKEYLSKLEWTIVAGDPPHGTDAYQKYLKCMIRIMLEKHVSKISKID